MSNLFSMGYSFLCRMDRARRRHIRYKVKDGLGVSYYVQRGGSRLIKCDIVNASDKGICIRVNALLDVNIEIKIVSTDLFEIPGKVIWVSDNYYGIKTGESILDCVEFDKSKKYLGI
jgi:hypothetical protein